MKFSIKRKLIMAMSGLIILYVGLSWVLNSQFLVQYYYLNKEEALRDNYQDINDSYAGKPFELLIDLERLERTESVHIIVLDSTFQIKYNSSMKEEEFFGKKTKTPRFPEMLLRPENAILDKTKDISNDQAIIQRTTDHRLNIEFINLVGKLNDGDIIFLSTPVVAIQESANIANKFFLVTGVFTILTGLILIFVFAGRFTKPIFQLNEIAQGMARLDFSKKYTSKTDDEIGELGQSINSLSDQLEESITELQQANTKLMEDIEKERKIDEMRKEFISNVSHELKTPIALIQGYAEGLKVNVNEKQEDKDFYCEVIMDESAKMDKLVKQLLDLSQIDAGYARLEKVDFDIADWVNRILRKNELLIKENNIDLQIEIKQNFVAHADLERMEQIMVNYLVNAINHSDARKLIKVTVQKCDDKGRISVFNSGEPIEPGLLDKIWMSFYKVDQARMRAYGGTGLGLSIVRAIQERHDNRYGAENRDGGVSFWFEVDISTKQAS